MKYIKAGTKIENPNGTGGFEFIKDVYPDIDVWKTDVVPYGDQCSYIDMYLKKEMGGADWFNKQIFEMLPLDQELSHKDKAFLFKHRSDESSFIVVYNEKGAYVVVANAFDFIKREKIATISGELPPEDKDDFKEWLDTLYYAADFKDERYRKVKDTPLFPKKEEAAQQ